MRSNIMQGGFSAASTQHGKSDGTFLIYFELISGVH